MRARQERRLGEVLTAAAPAARRTAPSPAVLAGLLRAADLAVLSLAAFLAHLGYFGTAALRQHYLLPVLGVLVAGGNLLPRFALYEFKELAAGSLPWRRLLGACSAVFLALIVGLFLTKTSTLFSRVWITAWYAGSLAGLIVVRLLVGRLLARWQRQGKLARNLVVIGAGEAGQRLIQQLAMQRDPGVALCGLFDDRRRRGPAEVAGHRVLGGVDEVAAFVRGNRVDQVIVALPWSAEHRVLEVVNRLRTLPVDVLLCPNPAAFHFPDCDVERLSGVTMLRLSRRPLSDWAYVAKAVEDRLLAAVALALALPLMLGIAALIKRDSPGPVLFRQDRYGFNNQLIRVYKFRTLYHDRADPLAERLAGPGDPRVTRIGAGLRRLSLDELPQLINVLNGDMSLVGPRPHAVAAKAGGRLYAEVVREYAARHRVKPGITGWAQVNGWRGETDTEDKIRKRVEYDLYYIDNWSLLFDLEILLRTLWIVLRGANAH